jgi:L-amino acid N-acyltransferase YncA
MIARPPAANVTICTCEEDHVAAVLRSVGFKFGRWVDRVLMQRDLGAGDSTPP